MALASLKRGFRASQVTLSVLLACFGVSRLLREVATATASPFLTSAAAAVIGSAFLGPFLFHLVSPPALRAFGLGKLRGQRVCIATKKRVEIAEDYQATVSVTRRWVFLGEPHDEDLFDSYSIDPNLDIGDPPYDSPDAIEVGRKRVPPNRLTIFWRSKTPILPFVEHTHQDSWRPPVRYDQPASFSEFACIEETGYFETVISAPFEIERAVLLQQPSFRRLDSDSQFIQFVLRSRGFRGGRCEIAPDGKTLTWTLLNPLVGRRYLCVFFRKGGLSYWKSRLETEREGRRENRLLPP